MNALEFRFQTGSLSTDLVATVGRRLAGGLERLTSTTRLTDWLTEAELLEAGPVAASSERRQVVGTELRQAQELREATYRLMLSRITGQPATAADCRVLNGWARKRRPPPQLREDGSLAPQRAATDDVAMALGVIARDAIDVLTGDRAQYLRACEAGDCGMLYLDHSQGRTRRWCSMKECGNRAKVAAHRARQREGATS
ncbi:CGNR zinc finger domain-containing protein [Kribbella ginsengisoli]